MSPDQVLKTATRLGMRLEARGDRLHIEAPAGVVTAEFRDALTHHKATLLRLLAPVPVEFVTLTGGLIVAVPALRLLLDLESRGFKQSLDAEGTYHIEGAGLTEGDRAAIHRWRLHLGALVNYEAPGLM